MHPRVAVVRRILAFTTIAVTPSVSVDVQSGGFISRRPPGPCGSSRCVLYWPQTPSGSNINDLCSPDPAGKYGNASTGYLAESVHAFCHEETVVPQFLRDKKESLRHPYFRLLMQHWALRLTDCSRNCAFSPSHTMFMTSPRPCTVCQTSDPIPTCYVCSRNVRPN